MPTNQPTTKADHIRKLHSEGKTISEVSKLLKIRYQHAYNVINRNANIAIQNVPTASRLIAGEIDAAPTVKLAKRSVGTDMFPRINYQVLRGMKELYLHRNLPSSEWDEVKAFFNHECAYCGKPDTGDPRNGLVPDHLIAVAENGDFIIGNVIAACHSCNDQRGKKPWRAWLMEKYSTEAPIRIQKIEAYLELYPYTPPAGPSDRLTEAELTQYYAILHDWNELWVRALKLRDQVSARRNLLLALPCDPDNGENSIVSDRRRNR